MAVHTDHSSLVVDRSKQKDASVNASGDFDGIELFAADTTTASSSNFSNSMYPTSPSDSGELVSEVDSNCDQNNLEDGSIDHRNCPPSTNVTSGQRNDKICQDDIDTHATSSTPSRPRCLFKSTKTLHLKVPKNPDQNAIISNNAAVKVNITAANGLNSGDEQTSNSGQSRLDQFAVEQSSVAQLSSEHTTTNLRSIVCSPSTLEFRKYSSTSLSNTITSTEEASEPSSATNNEPIPAMANGDVVTHSDDDYGQAAIKGSLLTSATYSESVMVTGVADKPVSKRLADCLTTLRSASSRLLLFTLCNILFIAIFINIFVKN